MVLSQKRTVPSIKRTVPIRKWTVLQVKMMVQRIFALRNVGLMVAMDHRPLLWSGLLLVSTLPVFWKLWCTIPGSSGHVGNTLFTTIMSATVR